jgi:hypothetical protein
MITQTACYKTPVAFCGQFGVACIAGSYSSPFACGRSPGGIGARRRFGCGG